MEKLKKLRPLARITFKLWKISYATMAAWSRTPEIHDEHENIEKKADIFHNLNGILAKTGQLMFQEKKTIWFSCQ